MTPFERIKKSDFVNYELVTPFKNINKTAFVLEKNDKEVLLQDSTSKFIFTKDFVNNKLKNVTVIYQD